MNLIIQLTVGLSLGLLVGLLAYYLGVLSRTGAWAAVLTGGLIFGLGGFRWAVLLLAFFVSSSAWSRLFARRKAALEEKYAKGSRRDWGQVMANGGLGALLAVFSALLPAEAWPWLAFSGAMAAVNADTWATELGVFNPFPPRLIITGKTVERGTSGGVTLLGYLAALGGSALIGALAVLLGGGIRSATTKAFAITLAGLAGSTFDSLLGATVQAIYFCPQCQKETERYPLHGCGARTIPLRGWRWLDNDWVNFACSLVGALTAWGVWAILN
jgi:uncharacterized protein (TIGR00297 family)